MTNHEWIKSLSKEDLAFLLSDLVDKCDFCAEDSDIHCSGDCFRGVMHWLDEKHKVIEYFEEAEDEIDD